jgi:antitoxin HicB
MMIVMATKDLNYYMRLPYTIQVVPEDGDGLWFAEVSELEGCMTQAESWEALYPMLRDAMAGWFSAALESGMDIPEPLTHIRTPKAA